MKETKELELEIKHSKTFGDYVRNNAGEMMVSRDAREFMMEILRRCDKKGITQGSISNRVDISRAYLNDMFNCRRNASRDMWLKVLIYLGIEKPILSKDEINYFLHTLGMRALYARDHKDAVLIYCLMNNDTIHSISQVDELLFDEVGWTICSG